MSTQPPSRPLGFGAQVRSDPRAAPVAVTRLGCFPSMIFALMAFATALATDNPHGGALP